MDLKLKATPKQMSYLRKLFYNSNLTQYKSYDLFDDSHIEYVSESTASMLINRMVNKHYLTESGREEIKIMLSEIEEKI